MSFDAPQGHKCPRGASISPIARKSPSFLRMKRYKDRDNINKEVVPMNSICIFIAHMIFPRLKT